MILTETNEFLPIEGTMKEKKELQDKLVIAVRQRRDFEDALAKLEGVEAPRIPSPISHTQAVIPRAVRKPVAHVALSRPTPRPQPPKPPSPKRIIKLVHCALIYFIFPLVRMIF